MPDNVSMYSYVHMDGCPKFDCGVQYDGCVVITVRSPIGRELVTFFINETNVESITDGLMALCDELLLEEKKWEELNDNHVRE